MYIGYTPFGMLSILRMWSLHAPMAVSAVVSLVVTVALLLSLAPVVPSASSSHSPITPIKHLIIVMMENHSFDNLFGIYPFASRNLTANPMNLTVPTNLLGTQYLQNLSPVPPGANNTVNPVEGYSVYLNDWNHGLMNGFNNNSGPQSMSYFTVSQMSLEWGLAQQFAIGDMYFSSMLSMTIPNRLLSLAGTTPVTTDLLPPPYVPLSSSIFGELNQYGISWGYYAPGGSLASLPSPLFFFQGISGSANRISSVDSFYSNLSGNTLPSVSWVMPLGSNSSINSQHPPENITYGEHWMVSLVNAVMNSTYWNSSAIMITYDEGGGYYDHVAPPLVNGHQLGFRVPFIVVSPFAKENYVSNTVLNHLSLLAFIEYNWQIPSLNTFVSSSNLPLDFFSFNTTYANGNSARTPQLFSQNGSFPLTPQYPFSSLPYSRTGSSSTNLTSLGWPIIAPQSTTPAGNPYLLPVLSAIASVGLLTISYYLIRRRNRR